MAINKKLIHFKTLEKFNTELANGNILDTSIVFIQDAQKIWTHGTLYDCDAAALREEIIKNEEVVAAALNDLQENKASKTYVDEAVASAGGGSDDIYVFEPTDFTQDDDGMTLSGTITLEEYEKIVNCRVLCFSMGITYNIIFATKLIITENTVGFATTLSEYEMVTNTSCIFRKQSDNAEWSMTVNSVFTFKTINGESIVGEGDITIEGGSSDANVQAVDTGDVLDDVNVNYATKTYVDGLVGDINSVLESIISGGSAALITFTVFGTEYQAEEGMTWEEFVNSEYANGDFTCDSNIVLCNNVGVCTTEMVYVNPSDIIIENYNYIKYLTGGGGLN